MQGRRPGRRSSCSRWTWAAWPISPSCRRSTAPCSWRPPGSGSRAPTCSRELGEAGRAPRWPSGGGPLGSPARRTRRGRSLLVGSRLFAVRARRPPVLAAKGFTDGDVGFVAGEARDLSQPAFAQVTLSVESQMVEGSAHAGLVFVAEQGKV